MQCWKSAAVSHTTTTALLLNFQNYGEEPMEPFDDFFRGDIYILIYGNPCLRYHISEEYKNPSNSYVICLCNFFLTKLSAHSDAEVDP